jgi:hypothetical protein
MQQYKPLLLAVHLLDLEHKFLHQQELLLFQRVSHLCACKSMVPVAGEGVERLVLAVSVDLVKQLLLV